MNVILLGPPGAGKGSQAARLAQCLGIVHVSTGDELRNEMRAGSEIGRIAKQYVDRGVLVPDELVIKIIEGRLGRNGTRGLLLDGFPRNVAQAAALDALLASHGTQVDHVVSLEVGVEEVIRRLSGRRVCRECQAPFHIEFDPPKQAGICSRCGGELLQRNDDREETIRTRLEIYERETAPLRDYYRKRGLLREVDGFGSAEHVFERIIGELRP